MSSCDYVLQEDSLLKLQLPRETSSRFQVLMLWETDQDRCMAWVNLPYMELKKSSSDSESENGQVVMTVIKCEQNGLITSMV